MKSLKYTVLERYCLLTGQEHSELTAEEQHSDYQAGVTEIDGQRWRIRTARITPTKSGGFVAIWQRDATGATVPFESEVGLHGVMVFIEEAEHFGVFRFTQQHLEALGVFASANAPGKRGFRVYPSWTTGLKGQAKKSQDEQLPAFSVLAD
ncbi:MULTISPECIES: MepB family protein [Micrococcaceae]|uniref:MepB family protein n=1 Tax=Micrococcaceae TaxID=1268 RepID=UPI001036F2CE|nr:MULTISPECIES: MepB family protein [Micrococcaceae]TAP24527.1 metallopeptidase [Arthrobacter sp. S41]UXN32313.1 MepB family protein [Glutamicibacter sp. M10]